MKIRGIKLVVCLLALTLLAVFVSGCSALGGLSKEPQGEQQTAESQKVPVEVATAGVDAIQNEKEFSGILKPINEAMVIPQIPAKVSKVHVKVGQQVKEGDVLIELEAGDVERQIAQAQAAYEASKASVELSKRKLQDLESQKNRLQAEIGKLDKQIEGLTKSLNEARQAIEPEIAKLQEMRQKGVISDEQFEEQKARLEEQLKTLQDGLDKLLQQKAALEKSKLELESAIKSLPYDSNTLDAQLNQAKVALDTAKSAADKLKLFSPIDGVVSSLSVQPGQMATQTSPPVTVIDTSALVLDIRLSEFDVAKVQPGQRVKVYVEAMGSQPVEGVIEWVSPSTDLRSQAYPARIKVENVSGKLRPGMFARVILVLDRKDNVVVVPKRSIIRQGDHAYVFVIKGKAVERREVKVGMDDGERVEIISGLQSGEQVVVKGQAYLKEGQEVNVVRQEG
ncbi:RND family efflux transporter MFP subunit [Caldicoprobacter guelmensis]|uniref:efflux RND transporter periplasmic adaptor subunit n=1 Tax=Caldicoprobacter guelmensis TaxID=1170224 RepID=UPI001959F555|nr:efflux RND transporter periplasmic adaptor subunit [Caldicoprobacter guelmensis]MBM7582247.1 RND family efflux transporter MFP subunit [Caldicoprobacter guelmensis]